MQKQNVSMEDLEKIMNNNRLTVNNSVVRYERLGSIVVETKELE